MKARIPQKDGISKTQMKMLKEIATEEYAKVSTEHGEGVARRVIKLMAQAMNEEYGWGPKGFQRVIDRALKLDAESDKRTDFMSHIDQNLKRLGYSFPYEDSEKWVVK